MVANGKPVQDNYPQALENYQLALVQYQEIDHYESQRDAMINMAEIYEIQEEYDLAKSTYEEAILIAEQSSASGAYAIREMISDLETNQTTSNFYSLCSLVFGPLLGLLIWFRRRNSRSIFG